MRYDPNKDEYILHDGTRIDAFGMSRHPEDPAADVPFYPDATEQAIRLMQMRMEKPRFLDYEDPLYVCNVPGRRYLRNAITHLEERLERHIRER